VFYNTPAGFQEIDARLMGWSVVQEDRKLLPSRGSLPYSFLIYKILKPKGQMNYGTYEERS